MGLRLALLVLALSAAALSSHDDQWRDAGLVAVLLLFTVVSDTLTLQFRGVLLSGSFIALVLAMALLGPAPAVAIGVASMLVDAVRRRPAAGSLISNLAAYATFPLAGGLLIQGVAQRAGLHPGDAPFLLLVFGTFVATNLLDFLLIASWSSQTDGIGIWPRFRTGFVPVLPSELAAALLTIGIVGLYAQVGLPALGLAAIVFVVFQYLLRELVRSEDRAEELAQRNTQLAALHLGVLTAMLQTLSLRDRSTARHSAAVARYARELAAAVGCSEGEQELVHTAALLHDIGKFIFPDSILFATGRLTEEQWRLVRLHPGQGAEVVGRVDGYAPVAEIIRSHHERPDGCGYPEGLRGEEIPLLARVIAVADAYDVMTARDSYRSTVASEEALSELRLKSGSQFDPWLVDAFSRLLEQKDVAFRHADDADFEAELGFERRVASFLAPRRAAVDHHRWRAARRPAARQPG
ncbi:MAG: HD-GYP domain-containing protein [Solirubrobacteraceae bacterium]